MGIEIARRLSLLDRQDRAAAAKLQLHGGLTNTIRAAAAATVNSYDAREARAKKGGKKWTGALHRTPDSCSAADAQNRGCKSKVWDNLD